MGLLDSMNNLKYEIQKQNTAAAKKAQLKEREEQIKNEINNSIIQSQLDYLNRGFNIFQEETRLEIYYTTLKDLEECNKLLYNKSKTSQYINANYYKLAEQAQKIYKYQQKDKIEAAAETKKQQKEIEKIQKQKQQQIQQAIRFALKGIIYLCLLLLAPIIIICYFIAAIAKN